MANNILAPVGEWTESAGPGADSTDAEENRRDPGILIPFGFAQGELRERFPHYRRKQNTKILRCAQNGTFVTIATVEALYSLPPDPLWQTAMSNAPADAEKTEKFNGCLMPSETAIAIPKSKSSKALP